MHLRPALVADAPAISALIQSLVHYFTVHAAGDGAAAFLSTLAPEAIAKYIAAPNFRCITAWEGDALAGIIALRDHIFHLFVAQHYQRQGIAAQLWAAVKTAVHPPVCTVNASVFSVPVYEKFGFTPTGPRAEIHGIAYVPMQRMTA